MTNIIICLQYGGVELLAVFQFNDITLMMDVSNLWIDDWKLE